MLVGGLVVCVVGGLVVGGFVVGGFVVGGFVVTVGGEFVVCVVGGFVVTGGLTIGSTVDVVGDDGAGLRPGNCIGCVGALVTVCGGNCEIAPGNPGKPGIGKLVDETAVVFGTVVAGTVVVGKITVGADR